MVREKVWKMIFFQVREKSGKSGLSQENLQKGEKVKEKFNGFLRISLPIKDCSLNDYFS